MTRILVIDDHPLFQEALISVIEQMNGDFECEAARNLEESFDLLTQMGPQHFDLVIMDLNLPNVCGLEGLTKMRDTYPDLPTVIISAEQDRTLIINTIAQGATGYICKSLSREEIAQGIEVVLSGNVFLPSAIIRAPVQEQPILNGQDNNPDSSIEKLTQRQKAVYKELVHGHSNKEIAYRLGVAEPTVKAHVSAIFTKLGVTSRTQAMLIGKNKHIS